jgi:hypothetical protein
MKVTFTENEFKDLRKFQNAFNKKLGSEAYVGTDTACLLVEYSPELKAMLRPFPPAQHLDYDLRCLVCEDCKKSQPYLCAVDKAFTETTYVCGDCISKRQKKGK